ncbi:MAG: bifunctional hydroxymethylpyrimidine kinase/phosphomethylpyrimidine kinase, partial [Deltaproteobacteria bacterium]|nr:bifunctional hydroxymethylpyrimidine kinase/phosphomethylpyrimidine kinase [Deltaproteobacteria bacterium]
MPPSDCSANVLIVGSSNFDLVVHAQHLPGPANTVLGGDYRTSPGGKGANQAVGLQRLGTPVRFLSRVGCDPYGAKILEQLDEEGISTEFVQRDDELPSGLALITIDGDGARSVVVSLGANSKVVEANVEAFVAASPAGGILLTQLEIPASIVHHLLRLAKRSDKQTVLHASPAVANFPRDALPLVDLLVLNQNELRELSGRPAQHIKTATAAAQELIRAGANRVLVTMGMRGVLVVSEKDGQFISGFKLPVVDNTVGSSAFVAGLVHHLSELGDATWDDNASMEAAVRFGLAAMACSLGRSGGQASLASREEVEEVLSGEKVLHSTLPADTLENLTLHAKNIRRRIIRMLSAARSGHPGGSLSSADILTSLYYYAMAYKPQNPTWPNRDRLVLSKGHAAPLLYSTLIEV